MKLVLLHLLLLQVSHPGEWEHVTSEDGLPPGQVRAVLQTSAGATWFAVRGHGLAALDDGTWTYVTTADGLVSNGVVDLHEIERTLWAVGFGGYSVQNGDRWQPFAELGGRSARVVFSLTPADGVIWFAANGFAARLDADGWEHFDPAEGLPHDVVHQVWVDKAEATWFACRRGLAMLRDGRLQVFHPGVNFRSIVEDDLGGLWFGTQGNGVFVYASGEWQRHLDGLTILPSLVDSRGHIWAQTEGSGVFRYDGEQWRQYTTEDGLLSDVVFDITEGQEGSIWFGTDRGASRYSP